MHIGLFGGSFDPPHICHTLFCLYVLETTEVEKILWVPCVEHPFGKPMAPFEHRLEMSRLAARPLQPRVEVSDIEKRLPQPNYTINTVEALRREMPGARISICIGSDILGEIERWQRIGDLRRIAKFVVVPRDGFTGARGDLDIALPPLSSTAIRQALCSGRSLEGVLPSSVRDYIERHGLYRT